MNVIETCVTSGLTGKVRSAVTEAVTPPGLFPATERIPDSDSVPPALPLRASPLRIPAPPLGVQWSDLAAIHSQLQIQSQVCGGLPEIQELPQSSAFIVHSVPDVL